MDFATMTIEQLQERRTAIAAEIDKPDADLDALENEARAIKDEIENRKAAESKRAEIRSAVADGKGEVTKNFKTEEKKKMTINEVRSMPEYVNAYANYIKTGKDNECRALFTANYGSDLGDTDSGKMPVPTIIEERIRTAWERSGLLELVRKTYVRGNLQVGFELSATGATVHAEGAAAPAEEVLTFGVVSLVPASIKKWIRISDEAYDLGGEEFLNYIYDEITHRIIMEAKRQLIFAIGNAPATSTATAIGVPTITGAPTLDIVAKAVANLSDEAENIAIVMNRLTHADFITAMAANGYMFDPFQGYAVHYDNALPAYNAAIGHQTWMIVGDFSGAQMNFPNGEEVKLKFDDLSEAESDLVKIVGRMFVAIGITAPGRFVNVTKAAGGGQA